MWRNTLADSVVDRYECAFGQQPLFDGAHQQLRICKQRTHKSHRQIVQGGEVVFGNQQTVSWENRAMIQKGQ